MESTNKKNDVNIIFSHVFKDNINRVWDCLRLPEIFNLTIKDKADNIIILNGKNYGELGTQVEYQWKDLMRIRFEVQEVINEEFYKRIRFYSTKIEPLNLKYSCVFHLHCNTIDKTTLFQHELIFDDPNFLKTIDLKHNKQEKMEMCKKIEKILSKRTEDLYQFESIMINTNIEKVWRVISDWKIFQEYVPIIAEQVDFEGGDPKTVGCRINIGHLSKNTKFSLKVLQCLNTIDKKEYVLEYLDGEPVSPKQELDFSLVLVNEQITYLSFKHQFKESIKYELISSIAREKKHILKELKKRIEREEAKEKSNKK